MLNVFRNTFVVAALVAVVPVPFHNQIQAGNHNCCCKTCRQPCCRCTCRTSTCATVVPQTAYQPVIETQYAQQPVLQQRDVLTTEYRTEPVTETVPATVVENMLVDEGSFQTVWVPRLTTKAIARTTYQSRTSYRTVPYQVSRRISEYGMQTVPYQTVRHIPTTGSSLSYSGSPGLSTAFLPPIYSGSPIVSGSSPTLASSSPIFPTPSSSIYPVPSTSAIATSAGSLVPEPRYADTPATPIKPRSASNTGRSSDFRSADRGTSLFVPAPSAALVWQTPRSAIR
jgi:hypothetical protein